MARRNIHAEPFDEGTLAKLEIFETYTREWLPVFLAPDEPFCDEVHIFDFFAGEGTDSSGAFGSPLRILRQLKDYEALVIASKIEVAVHFYDKSATKIEKLKHAIDAANLRLSGITWDIRPLRFDQAFQEASRILRNRKAAKLVLA